MRVHRRILRACLRTARRPITLNPCRPCRVPWRSAIPSTTIASSAGPTRRRQGRVHRAEDRAPESANHSERIRPRAADDPQRRATATPRPRRSRCTQPSKTRSAIGPALPRAPESEQIRQVAGVAFVVLHPPVAPILPDGCAKCTEKPSIPEQVHRPLPAIGRFDRHPTASPAALTTSSNRIRSFVIRRRTTVHPPRASRRSPNGDDAGRSRLTSIRRGLHSSRRNWFGEAPSLDDADLTRSRGPAPSSHPIVSARTVTRTGWLGTSEGAMEHASRAPTKASTSATQDFADLSGTAPALGLEIRG